MSSIYPSYSHMAMVPSTIQPLVQPLQPAGCVLAIRQEPKEALVTTSGKEKGRKPVDPPPILELSIKSEYDPTKQYLQSPYLFVAVSLYKADRDEPHDSSGEKSLAGTLVSSLHRLKDVNNQDAAFFVFGDISIRVAGRFRLHFSLFEFQSSLTEVQYLGSIDSAPFSVLLPKDFKGLEESTYLSRAFSDQGVRLRLRKEARSAANKRKFDDYPSEPALRPNNHSSDYSQSYEDPNSPSKRHKSHHDDRKDSFPENANASTPQHQAVYTGHAGYNATSYPATSYSAGSYTPSSYPASSYPTQRHNNYHSSIPYTSSAGTYSPSSQRHSNNLSSVSYTNAVIHSSPAQRLANNIPAVSYGNTGTNASYNDLTGLDYNWYPNSHAL